eukprot:TRINITY_DN10683_c0_g1_i4.p1 TRINITY_DN10683_c0_g1~~TRINITY_DN10683_c0_g1_i4.p1  ORF type:complete len:241 (-),score=56.03 TRINITY_DN10683_c0_g1_i4:107-829(-)
MINVLELYLNANKAKLASNVGDSDMAKNDAFAALLLTQDSAVVQMLLETCLLTSCSTPERAALHEEALVMLCERIHKFFVESPILIKLVSFQGYPPSLIPIMVHGVPSMHLCLDFLPELLRQASPERRVFGVLLSGCVCARYPLPKSLELANQVVELLACIHPGSDLAPYLEQLLPAAKHLCLAFPSLVVGVVAALSRIRSGFLGKSVPGCLLATDSAQATEVVSRAYEDIIQACVIDAS